MSVRTKNRRKIVCDGQVYLWYIRKDEEACDKMVLHIISEDKKLILSCPLEVDRAYAISKGSYFQDRVSDGCWKRYLMPMELPSAVTPKYVAELISWATQGRHGEEVIYNGNDICL